MLPVLDRAEVVASPNRIVLPPDDGALLDAYSQTVSGVVEDARDSVVNIRVRHTGNGSRNGRGHQGEG